MKGEPIRPQVKDPRGAARIKQQLDRKDTIAKQRAVMEAAKKRDGHKCRWPHETKEEADVCRMFSLHAAHLNHRGMGGDPELVRTKRELLVSMSTRCHDRFDGRIGTPGTRRFVYLDPKKKADGPMACEVKRGGQWVEIGREISIGVWA